jgi:predicted nuclease of predicted toxin-antitoxin system
VNSLRFIVDEMLPQHLTYCIRNIGYEATHAEFEGLKSSSDSKIWRWAAEHDAIVISKDADFQNRLVIGSPPRLIWIRWGNTRKQVLTQRISEVWPGIIDAFEVGDWKVELADRWWP